MPFTGGSANKSAVFNGRIIMINNSEQLWSSRDGSTWINHGEDLGLPENAYGASLNVFGNYLWLRASGWSRFRGNYDNAMYRSSDGINWRIGLSLNAK